MTSRIWRLQFEESKLTFIITSIRPINIMKPVYEDMIFLNICGIYFVVEYKHNSFKYIYEMTFTMAGSTDACENIIVI